MEVGVASLANCAKANFTSFVKALWLNLCGKVDDPSGIMTENPWETSDGVDQVSYDNIKSCGGVLNNSQKVLKDRILFVEREDHVMDPFRRSKGPGLCIIVWLATEEFFLEVEVDCRGKVDLIETTKRAVVTGAEIKTSSTDIPKAKRQLVRRFKIIAKVLHITLDIDQSTSVFVGRVYYRNVPSNAVPAEAEDGSGNDINTVSFYLWGIERYQLVMIRQKQRKTKTIFLINIIANNTYTGVEPVKFPKAGTAFPLS